MQATSSLASGLHLDPVRVASIEPCIFQHTHQDPKANTPRASTLTATSSWKYLRNGRPLHAPPEQGGRLYGVVVRKRQSVTAALADAPSRALTGVTGLIAAEIRESVQGQGVVFSAASIQHLVSDLSNASEIHCQWKFCLGKTGAPDWRDVSELKNKYMVTETIAYSLLSDGGSGGGQRAQEALLQAPTARAAAMPSSVHCGAATSQGGATREGDEFLDDVPEMDTSDPQERQNLVGNLMVKGARDAEEAPKKKILKKITAWRVNFGE
ncbi:hypothetical protein GGX14DRAFT_544481 [Mycena pura]|uniref:Uncharacterized protein n=1 Tax=Mycena pura TaxID=153505 RepID=A0AAD6V706_9AGAR|nr:hypothetical protein GGX14DRAFT_544481 [Mycena pura]